MSNGSISPSSRGWISRRQTKSVFRRSGWRVSRRHAEVFVSNDKVFVRDLDSTFGTLVNDRKLEQAHPLKDGDEIRIGPHALKVAWQRPGEGLIPAVSEAAVAAPAVSRPAALSASDTPQPPDAPAVAGEAHYRVRKLLHDRLLEAFDVRRTDTHRMADTDLRELTERLIRDQIQRLDDELPPDVDRQRLLEEVRDEAIGLGPLERAAEFASLHGITHLIVAMPGAAAPQRRHALDVAGQVGLPVLTVPTSEELLSGRAVNQVRDIEPEDLLGREPVELDEGGISECLNGKVVLITGAGGSIGSELCRQIARFGVSRLVCVDVSEFGVYQLEQELRDDAAIPANVTAKLTQNSVLGSQYLELTVPAAEEPTGTLQDGAIIPLSRTSQYASTEEVLSALSLVLNGSGLQQVRTVTSELGRARVRAYRMTLLSDAQALPLWDGSVDRIVTSPPYLGTYDYVDHHVRRYPWLGIDPTPIERGEMAARRHGRASPAGATCPCPARCR